MIEFVHGMHDNDLLLNEIGEKIHENRGNRKSAANIETGAT